MCRAVAVGGGDLPNEGEIGRRQQWEGAARGGWETKESRGGDGEGVKLIQEKPKIKNRKCLKTWPTGRFGRVRIQVRPKSVEAYHLQLGLGHMQSLQYDS